MTKHRLTRSVFALLSAIALLASLALPTFAWTGGMAGPGPALGPSDPVGYYIWGGSDDIHVRTHGPGGQHHFVAHVTSNGVFENVDSVRLEDRDSVRVVDGGHTLVLDFHTYDATDGVNFDVRGGSYVTFDLELDGHQIRTDRIFLGADRHHPRSNPFTILR